jgi:hypothetical protein
MLNTLQPPGAAAARGFIPALRSRAAPGNWIRSPAFDTFLLILAPLVTLPIIAGVYWSIPFLAITCGVVLAFAHYSSTIAFYFWDDSREYHRTRWLAFYGGPVLIIAVYVTLIGFDVPYVIQFILFFWNTFHVSRQNCGILAIYRQRAGIADPGQRSAANNAIIATSAFLALWNIGTHIEVSAIFGMVSADFGMWVRVTAGVLAAYFLGRLAIALARRKETIGVPEGVFLAASIGFFYPYLFIRDSGMATFAMLLPHYVQYMALVWLLHRRKFGGAITGAPAPLIKISSRLVFLIPTLVAAGYFFYLMKDFFDSNGYAHGFESLYLLIAMLHFYLDGLIWSFKRPHVRKTIGTYLFRRPDPAAVELRP